MNAKFTLAIIALIGIGVFALPSTMSLFAGQHSFYNIDATGNQVPCVKCHGDVKAELAAGNPSAITGTKGPHAEFKCEYCHRIEQGSSSGDNAVAVIPYENAAGKLVRFIVIPVSDMEAGNFPEFIQNTSMGFSPANLLNGTKLQFGNGNISVNNSDVETLEVAPRNDWNLVAAYNATLGTPKDTNPATMNGGIDPSKVAITVLTSRPYFSVSFYGAGSQAVNPGSAYHAASLVSCMECHGGEEPMAHYQRVADGTQNGGAARCSDCHYGAGPVLGARWTQLAAGGFGLTTSANDTGTSEAHNAWVKTDDGINRFGGLQGKEANNGACIGCHTHVAVDIAFNKGYKLAFSATETALGVYSVNNAVVEGTVHVDIYGNQSGETYGVGGLSYTWTPNTQLYMNGGSTVISGLNGDSGDSASALTTP